MAMPKAVVIDSSALVALLNVTDADHPKTANSYNELTKQRTELILQTEVLAETLNVLGKKVDRQAAANAGKAILLRQALGEIKLISSEIKTLALAVDLQLSGLGRPSFVDCLVMAQADISRTAYIFGFDTTFSKNGYQLPK